MLRMMASSRIMVSTEVIIMLEIDPVSSFSHYNKNILKHHIEKKLIFLFILIINEARDCNNR